MTTSLTSENDTVTASGDFVAGCVMKAWDDLAVPSRPTNLTPAGLDFFVDSDFPAGEAMKHIELLESSCRELAMKTNQQEAVSQSLAEANLRQTKIITALRADAVRLKLKLRDKELGK